MRTAGMTLMKSERRTLKDVGQVSDQRPKLVEYIAFQFVGGAT